MSEGLAIIGDTYEVRDRLSAMGCSWDPDARCWMAPDEGARAQGQALVDAEPVRKWKIFADGLPWVHGSLSSSTYEAALRAASLGVSADEVCRLAEAMIGGAGAPVKPAKIQRDVLRGYDYAAKHGEVTGKSSVISGGGVISGAHSFQKPVAKPEFEASKLVVFAGDWARTIDTAWLADRSPVDPTTATRHDFLRSLYREGERVVVLDIFASQGQWLWSHAAGFESSRIDYPAWDGHDALHATAPWLCAGAEFAGTGPRGIWYLCNPVSGEWFMTGEEDKRGRAKWSRRSEPSVMAWRYFALESDEADPRLWVAALAQLPLRIAAIYTSGGFPASKTSIHFLLRVDARSKAEFDEWRALAKRTMIPLGADEQCMSAVRLTRLPDCWREGRDDKTSGEYMRFGNPQLQKLLYLDPEPGVGALIDRAPIRDTFGPWESWTEAMVHGPREDADPEEIERLRVGLRKFSGERAQRCRELLRAWA